MLILLPVAVTAMESALNQDLKALNPPSGVSPEYVAWGLRANEQQILNNCRKGGTTVHSIEMPRLYDFELPVAPTNEQHRIVEKIEAMFDEIDKGVESLKTAKSTLDLYLKSLLKSAFEGRLTADWRARNPDKIEDPEILLARIRKECEAEYQSALEKWEKATSSWVESGKTGKRPTKPKRIKALKAQYISEAAKPNMKANWGSARLGELNIRISDGPFGSNLKTRDYVDEGIRVIRLENIGFGQFLDEKKSFVSKEKYESISKYSVRPGAIVVSSFVTNSIRSCLVPSSISVAINKADCFAITSSGVRANREFLAYYLQSKQSFDQLESLVHGVGRPRINTTQLKELHLPICSEAEQAEIVRILDTRLDAAKMLRAEIDTNLARAESLRQTILKQAFSGKLVPQDPNDEPAAVLLNRIKAENGQASGTRGGREAR